MKTFFSKTILSTVLLRLFAFVAVLGMAVVPLVRASAAGQYDPPVPPAGPKQISNERLEQVWARQLRIYDRLGNRFEREDVFMGRVQRLIDRAKANGKDVSAPQAALDAFEAARKEAQPIYESARSLVNSHPGFDDSGKVTDPAKAQETVKAMHEKRKEIRDVMNGVGRALREAIRGFREANPPPQPKPAS